MLAIVIGLMIGIGIGYLLYLLGSFILELLDFVFLTGLWPCLLIVVILFFILCCEYKIAHVKHKHNCYACCV